MAGAWKYDLDPFDQFDLARSRRRFRISIRSPSRMRKCDRLPLRGCAEKDLRCTPTLMYLEGKHPGRPLPERDLFIKPVNGRGGRGAERWDHAGPSLFIRPGTNPLDGHALLSRLVAKSRRRPLIVQPRLLPHDGLCTITTGALPTLRVLTCLNTNGEPEVVAAMLRSSCGTSSNRRQSSRRRHRCADRPRDWNAIKIEQPWV